MALLLASSCVQFQVEEDRPLSPADGRNAFCQLPSMEPEYVNFHMGKWPEARQIIHERLSSTPGLIATSSHGNGLRLRIVMEAFPVGKHHADFLEGDPFAFTWRRLSQAAFRWTFGIIPIYEPREQKLSFQVWQGNTRIRQFEYVSNTHVLVGLPAIILTPFVENRDVVDRADRMSMYFLQDACFHPVLALAP